MAAASTPICATSTANDEKIESLRKQFYAEICAARDVFTAKVRRVYSLVNASLSAVLGVQVATIMQKSTADVVRIEQLYGNFKLAALQVPLEPRFPGAFGAYVSGYNHSGAHFGLSVKLDSLDDQHLYQRSKAVHSELTQLEQTWGGKAANLRVDISWKVPHTGTPKIVTTRAELSANK